MSDRIEEPFFFESGKYKLFAVLHNPIKNEKKIGLVFCHPFAEEKLYSHRVMVNFARLLADNGYHSLLFDFHGNGDSTGDFEECTVSGQIADIKNAIKTLKVKTNVRKVGLLGLRFGGSLIALAEKQCSRVDFLIFWEPLVNLHKYWQQILRLNLAFQMALYRKIILTRKQLVEKLMSGKAINLSGYYMGGNFFKEAYTIDLLNYVNFIEKKCMIVQMTANNKLPVAELKTFSTMLKNKLNCSIFQVAESPFWEELKIHYPSALNTFEKTLNWLDDEIS